MSSADMSARAARGEGRATYPRAAADFARPSQIPARISGVKPMSPRSPANCSAGEDGENKGEAQAPVGGAAFISDGISDDHRRYLALGGVGFILGDDGLTYGREQVIETYYTLHLWR